MSEQIINFGEELLISNLEAMLQAIPAIEAGVSFELVADDLHDIDTAGIQFLLALIKTFNDKSIQWHWQSASKVLVENAAMIGMLSNLQLDSFEGGA